MNENQTIVKKDIGKQALLFLGCAAFVFGSFHMMKGTFGSSRRYSPEFLMVVGIIGMLFFGFGAIAIIFSFLKSSPALIINEKGIRNYSHAGSSYLIEWNNIKVIKIITVSGKKLIAVELKDNQKIFNQVNAPTRALMKLNARFYGTPAFIVSSMIGMKIEDILSLIRQKRNELKKKTGIHSPTDEKS
jgi:hypothetical protein